MSKPEKEIITLREALTEIYIRISHIEDIEADNRELIIKSIKQNNQIIKFLASVDDEFEIEEIKDTISSKMPSLPLDNDDESKSTYRSIKELIDLFLSKHKDLEEFEEELEKAKGDITPGQVGEA